MRKLLRKKGSSSPQTDRFLSPLAKLRAISASEKKKSVSSQSKSTIRCPVYGFRMQNTPTTRKRHCMHTYKSLPLQAPPADRRRATYLRLVEAQKKNERPYSPKCKRSNRHTSLLSILPSLLHLAQIYVPKLIVGAAIALLFVVLTWAAFLI